MIRDAFFMPTDAYRAMQARADRNGVNLDPKDLKRGDPAPLFGLPVIEAPDLPFWIQAIVLNDPGGTRAAILPGGRIFLAKSRDRVSLGGVDWIRGGTDPDRVGVPCFLSLEAIDQGDALFAPDLRLATPDQDPPASLEPVPLHPLTQARLKASAVDRILDFQPRRIGR